MEELFLCSRAEILRAVRMDTGRKVAIVGAPDRFTDWMEKLLPGGSFVVSTPEDLPREGSFDIIIYWGSEGSRPGNVQALLSKLSETGELWISIPHGGLHGKLSSLFRMDEDRALTLTATRELAPVLGPFQGQ